MRRRLFIFALPILFSVGASAQVGVTGASGQVVIKGTNPSVAGSKGSILDEAGTYSLDNTNFVSCPTD